MRQRPRDITPGIRHVVVGAVSPERYYRDDVDHMAWTRRLGAVLDRHDWTCIIVCELPTHVHLLIDVPNETLPTGMHWETFPFVDATLVLSQLGSPAALRAYVSQSSSRVR